MFKLFNFLKVKNQVFNFEHKKMLNKLSINIAEIPDNIKLTLEKNNSCCFRDNYKEHTLEISILSFNKNALLFSFAVSTSNPDKSTFEETNFKFSILVSLIVS